MDGHNTDKKYESIKIGDRRPVQGSGATQPSAQAKAAAATADISDQDAFYEIEYDACPIPGVGKFVLKPQKIEPQENDIIRERFRQMRDIARDHRYGYNYSQINDGSVHRDNAESFYKQGIFMQDFTDSYEGNAEFSAYYPYYQMMGYEQLRTYFTWRTRVRVGHVATTSLSYVFLYIYELINNIGVSDPQDGLDKLVSFWRAYIDLQPAQSSNANTRTIDKYISKWLKDYYVYYQLSQSFKAFVDENNLAAYYPGTADTDDIFYLSCAVSKYDIRKSPFFSDDKLDLIIGCFHHIMDMLEQVVAGIDDDFGESVLLPTRQFVPWKPFRDALFHHHIEQPDRRVVLSENELYICEENTWVSSTVLVADSVRQLNSYIMKRIESNLRRIMGYKRKLTANISTVQHPVVYRLNARGLSLEKMIDDAVADFYREATKTVVKVDRDALSKIREEALATQEKLVVPEQVEPLAPVVSLTIPIVPAVEDTPPVQPLADTPTAVSDVWVGLKNALTTVEIGALSVVMDGEAAIKQFADESGIMLEVLVDGINEKAMDFIGDNLMDEEFILYDDYKDQIKELIG